MLRIELPSFPPSVNQLYVSAGRYRNLSPKARLWIAQTKEHLKNLAQPEEFIGKRLKVDVIFQGPLWVCKNGNDRIADVSSREKCLIDTIFSLWPDLDDHKIWEITLRKVEAEQEKVSVLIEVYN